MRAMTSDSVLSRDLRSDDERWRSIFADLSFWTVAGVIVAVLSGPLGRWWDVPQPVLLAGAVLTGSGGIGLLFALNRMRPTQRRMVRGFAVFNLAFAPLVWVTALFGWLPLSTSGNWALAVAGDVAFVFGVWQLLVARR